MWIALAIGSAVFAGLTSVLAKAGLKKVDSNLATALRTIVVVVFSWLMVFFVGSQNTISQIQPKSLLFLILSGLATGLSWMCYFKALQIGDVNKVVPVDKSSTLLTMLFAFVFLGETFTWIKGISMVFIAVGTYLMIERKELKSVNSNVDEKSKSWLLYAVLSAVFASLTSILGKIGIENIDSYLGTAIRTIVVLTMAWIIVLAQGKQKDIKHIDRRSWVFIAFSGLATGLSWMCYYKALQTGPASVVVPIDKLSILITVLFGYLMFNEKLTKKSASGLILLTVGTLALVFFQ